VVQPDIFFRGRIERFELLHELTVGSTQFPVLVFEVTPRFDDRNIVA